MMKRIIAEMLLLFTVVFLAACGSEEKQSEIKEAEQLIIEHVPDITETEEFEKAVEERVNHILSRNVVLTVYAEGVEDFCYRGTLEVVDDGTDDSDLIIFIHCDQQRENESDWW